jgi:arginyl-tRNA synthetase
VGEFYQTKVIGSKEEDSRVALLLATKKVMETCFDLLGMKTIDRI